MRPKGEGIFPSDPYTAQTITVLKQFGRSLRPHCKNNTNRKNVNPVHLNLNSFRHKTAQHKWKSVTSISAIFFSNSGSVASVGV